MPTPTVYLVRHAESVHNVSKDFSHRDPPLTTTGLSQANALAASFPNHAKDVAVVLTSPLTRTIETTVAAFGHVLHPDPQGGPRARLVIDPHLQERSDLPCDTGSDRDTLRGRFPSLSADLGSLEHGWYEKQGIFAADDDTVPRRADLVRQQLGDLVDKLASEEGTIGGGRDIVVVTHGVFMKFLAEDPTIDLPKAGWKAFSVTRREADGRIALAPLQSHNDAVFAL